MTMTLSSTLNMLVVFLFVCAGLGMWWAVSKTKDNVVEPKIRVYLDDERVTPDGWVRTNTVAETIALIQKDPGRIESISLDNDLGDTDHKTEGYQVLLWLEEQLFYDPCYPVPTIFVHSANAARAPMMRRLASKLMDAANFQGLK